MEKDPTKTPPKRGANEQPDIPATDNQAAAAKADAGSGEITITAASGDTLSLYSEQELTATYTGSDERVKTIGWTAEQVAPPAGDTQIMVMFDPPRSELVNNQAKTKVLIYGAFAQPDDEIKGIDIYARVLETDVDVQRGMKNFPCTVPAVPSGNLLVLDSVEGDPVATGEAFHMYVATCSTYDGKPPVWPPNWNPVVEWSATIASPAPSPEDAQVQLMSLWDDSATAFSPTGDAGPAFASNGVRVISSEPVVVALTATITSPEYHSRTIKVQFQKDAILPLQGTMELNPQDPMPWVANSNRHTINLQYDRSGGVPEETPVFWRAWRANLLAISNARTLTDTNQSTSNSAWQVYQHSRGDNGYWDMSGTIVTRSLNPQTGAYDHGKLPVFYRYADGDAIVIEPDQQEMFGQKLYAPRTLNATYTGDKTFSQVMWSVDLDENPEYTINFKPNLSRVTTQGEKLTTSTQMTVTGPNKPVTVTVYARSVDGDFVTGWSSLLTFHPAEKVPQANAIELISLDGDTLKERDDNGPQWHLLQATYRQLDGTPVAEAPLTWSASDKSVTFAQPTGGKTDANGVVTNVMQTTRTDPFDFTVTVSADNTEDTVSVPLTFQPEVHPLPEQQLVTITSPGGLDKLEFDKAYKVVADFGSSSLPQVVTWTAFPADRLSFTRGETQFLGQAKQGVTNYVKASPGPDIPVAVISVRSFHSPSTYWTTSYPTPNTVGIYDHSEPDLVLGFGAQQSDEIVISPEEDQPLDLYKPHQIDGTYLGDKQFKEIFWSVDPNENPTCTITFEPNPSRASLQKHGLKATTQMKVYGANEATKVTVYAHSAEGDYVKGTKAVDFRAVSKPPQKGSIELVSLEGDPLAKGDQAPLIRATYTRFGSRVAYSPLTWTIVDDPSGTVSLLATNGETQADGVMSNGVTTNGVTANSANPVTFTVKVTSDDYPDDSGTLTLTFQPAVTPLPGQGSMKITSSDSPPLTFSDRHTLSVKYLDGNKKPVPDGTEVTWQGFPSGRLIFGPGTKTADGVATNTVQAVPGADLDDAVVMTTHFNKETGAYDYGYLPLVFRAHQKQGLSGIIIDKPVCTIPVPIGTSIDPRDPAQVIRCQVQVSGASGAQSVSLPITPDDAAATMYDASTYKALPVQGGAYTIQTDAETGLATFLVGSTSYDFFTLNARWQEQKVSAPLVIGRGSGGLSAPTVPRLEQRILQVPPPPAPTFQVFIPDTDVARGTPVALLLNNRVVWEGPVDPTVAIEVAYAALDVGPDGTNTLIYVTQDLTESQPAGGRAFRAQGTPQTGPDTGGVVPSKAMPTVDTKTPRQVTPQDIAGAGLLISVPPYDAAVGDMITVYAYLSGDTLDLLSGRVKPAKNIVARSHHVLRDSPLLSGKPAAFPLPQWALAGYAQGQLQVNYKVLAKGAANPLWSFPSHKCVLNTTFF